VLLNQLQLLGLERAFEVQDKTLPLTLDGKYVNLNCVLHTKKLLFICKVLNIGVQMKNYNYNNFDLPFYNSGMLLDELLLGVGKHLLLPCL